MDSNKNETPATPPESNPVDSPRDDRNLPSAIAEAFRSGANYGNSYKNPTFFPQQDGKIALPEGWNLQDIKVDESLLPRPRRLKQHHSFYNVSDVIQYVNRYKTGTSLILLSPEPVNGQPCARIILDYHPGKDEPAWGEHVVDLIFRTSWQFDAISELTRAKIPQDQFALALRDIAGFCESVPAAELIEVARTLSLTVKGNFKSITDEFNGSIDFAYGMQVTGSAGTETRKLTVPQQLDWKVPILLGGAKQLVQTDFIYGIPQDNEKVKMGLRMHGRGEMLMTLTESIRAELELYTALMAVTAATPGEESELVGADEF